MENESGENPLYLTAADAPELHEKRVYIWEWECVTAFWLNWEIHVTVGRKQSQSHTLTQGWEVREVACLGQTTQMRKQP